MGKNYIYHCEECSEKYETSGPWDYYCDEKGKRKPYGYPGPYTKDAQIRGIDGLFADMLCLDCARQVNVVLEQFNESIDKNSQGLFKVLFSKGKNKDSKGKCPYCKSENLFLSYSEKENKEISCPKCNEGKLEITDQWFPGED